jgi:hypothetical protein
MLLKRVPGTRANFIGFDTSLPTSEVEARLMSSGASGLLLKKGDSLSDDKTDRYYRPDLGLYIGQARLIGSRVVAWGWDYDDKDNRTEPENAARWDRKLDIGLLYSNGKEEARQEICVQAWSDDSPRTMPELSRIVRAPAYSSMGYSGHKYKERRVRRHKEIINLVDLARAMFEARIQN